MELRRLHLQLSQSAGGLEVTHEEHPRALDPAAASDPLPRPTEAAEPHRSARSLSTADAEDLGANSILLEGVVDPAVRKRAETLLANLDSITVEQICETAEKSQVVDDENAARAFAI
jgi:hypothetical protein